MKPEDLPPHLVSIPAVELYRFSHLERLALDQADELAKANIAYRLLVEKYDLAEERSLLEIRDKEAAQAQVTALSIDLLTGLPVRRIIQDAYQTAHREIVDRKATGNALSNILCDIDHFKKINDTYGHHAGDQILKEVGRIIHDAVRAEDEMGHFKKGRYGGEEFLILVHDDIDKAAIVAERIRRTVEKTKFNITNKKGYEEEIRVKMSFGISTYSTELDDKSSEPMHLRADTALYASKQNGRNAVTITRDGDHFLKYEKSGETYGFREVPAPRNGLRKKIGTLVHKIIDRTLG